MLCGADDQVEKPAFITPRVLQAKEHSYVDSPT